MRIIGYIEYSQEHSSAPEYLAENMNIAILGYEGKLFVVPVRSMKFNRNGLVFVNTFPDEIRAAECNEHFENELQRNWDEMCEESATDDDSDL